MIYHFSVFFRTCYALHTTLPSTIQTPILTSVTSSHSVVTYLPDEAADKAVDRIELFHPVHMVFGRRRRDSNQLSLQHVVRYSNREHPYAATLYLRRFRRRRPFVVRIPVGDDDADVADVVAVSVIRPEDASSRRAQCAGSVGATLIILQSAQAFDDVIGAVESVEMEDHLGVAGIPDDRDTGVVRTDFEAFYDGDDEVLQGFPVGSVGSVC